jgi:hypothetical protein
MANAVVLARSYVSHPLDVLRFVIVLGCALALIAAERALPLF